MNKRFRQTALAAGTALTALIAAQQSHAQDNAQPVAVAEPAQTEEEPADAIVVVGSQIKGASTTAALPVSVIDSNQIDATGAVSGDELFRSIPQAGDVTFNEANNPQTSNAARGDVNSINLRNLGIGNTLVLLNGRRLVQHPTSQAGEGNVPVLSYNANSLPVAGIERLEILRDGAAAIYGADAVAGVVNTVTKSDFGGVALDLRYGGAEGTHRREFQATGRFGHNFDQGRGNISLYLDYTRRTAQLAEDQVYTASDNLVDLFAGDPAFAGNLTADGRATQAAWAALTVVGGPGTIRRSPGNVALTNSQVRSTSSLSSIRVASSPSMPTPASARARARPRRRSARSGSTRAPARPSLPRSIATTASSPRITTCRTASRSMAKSAITARTRTASSRRRSTSSLPTTAW